MSSMFWQVYKYARFTVNGTEYRKLRKQYNVDGGVINAENIATGAKVFFLPQTPVAMMSENQDTTFRKPEFCELHLRNR